MWTDLHETTLQALIAKAVKAYPYNEARILRGADLVREGGVVFRQDGSATVTSNHHNYHVNGACPCVDVAQGNAPDGNCKHKWAKSLAYKVIMATPSERWTARDYVATAGGFDGVARQVSDAMFHFHPYTPDGKVLRRYAELALHEVALGPKVIDVVAAYGPIVWADDAPVTVEDDAHALATL